MRNLVICADGTCNAFGDRSSNVARLLESIELQSRETQLVWYDQGIGTRSEEHARVREFEQRLRKPHALTLLPPPDDSWRRPRTWWSLVRSMTHGDGLDVKVGRLYEELAKTYEPDDRVFLFGFSRGAFAVRALAGLTWRYGLPASREPAAARVRFAEAWPLFRDEFPDPDGLNAAKADAFRQAHGQRCCTIHFMGLWDTVKSYGGLQPVKLPHLRHNPSVAVVRHALALDERRGWFEVTTWGWLDSDRQRGAAASRLTEAEKQCIASQDVVEVWFSGCHSDVGGGGAVDDSSSIARRWLLAEAWHEGLAVAREGAAFLTRPAGDEKPRPTNSRTVGWRIVDAVTRNVIDNAGEWPITVRKRGAAPRRPQDAVRDGTVWYHESVTNLSRFSDLSKDVILKPYATRRTVPSL